jgi:cytochrome c553
MKTCWKCRSQWPDVSHLWPRAKSAQRQCVFCHEAYLAAEQIVKGNDRIRANDRRRAEEIAKQQRQTQVDEVIADNLRKAGQHE